MILEISDFIPEKKSFLVTSGSVGWESPSNLAIVKYWGKHGVQLPSNPSISITLSEARTKTQLTFDYDPTRKNLDLTFYFEKVKNPAFEKRVRTYLVSLQDYFPFLAQSRLVIHSENTFPHSSGIASSASGMSALALCLCSIEKDLGIEIDEPYFFQKASFISRLGSGSACRSIHPNFALWGQSEYFTESSDLYAKPLHDFHEVYNGLRNDILIVSKKEKSVSSSAGHALMKNNPYRQIRFSQASSRIGELSKVLKNGDVRSFGKLLESEALTLHALMMASDPSYILMEPNTIAVLNEIRSFRVETHVPVYFSLDAGPNVHIISFEENRSDVVQLLDRLMPFSEQSILNDRIGQGPREIVSS